jgi:hypothetical protein
MFAGGQPMITFRHFASRGNERNMILFALRTGAFAAAMILLSIVGTEGSAVVLRWRSSEMSSREPLPASSRYAVSVRESDSMTPPNNAPFLREVINMANTIASVIDRIADGFRLSGSSDRISRVHRIVRIERVSRMDRIFRVMRGLRAVNSASMVLEDGQMDND